MVQWNQLLVSVITTSTALFLYYAEILCIPPGIIKELKLQKALYLKTWAIDITLISLLEPRPKPV